MPKLKQGTIIPTAKEEILINRGIDSDRDTYMLSEQEFKQLRPVGRPKATITKDRITIRLSKEVTEYFRSSGKGWQTKIDRVLKEYIANH